jgi:hypothetical protein
MSVLFYIARTTAMVFVVVLSGLVECSQVTVDRLDWANNIAIHTLPFMLTIHP